MTAACSRGPHRSPSLAACVLAAPFVSAQPKEVPTPIAPAQAQASKAEAQRLSDAFVTVAERVSPSVVQIDVTARDENSDQVLRWLGRGAQGDSPVARGTGSGVVFTADANHVRCHCDPVQRRHKPLVHAHDSGSNVPEKRPYTGRISPRPA